MKLVGAQATRFCKKPDAGQWAFLLFGDDDGVISDAAIALRRALSGGREETEHITIDEDEIKREPAILFDALEARSLLGSNRIIRIRTAGDKIGALLIEALSSGDKKDNRFEAKLIITAGSLQKKSKLRAFAESAGKTTALQFFSDETADIATMTRAKLSAEGVAIEDDALNIMVSELPGHRGMANQEIEKLVLFGHGLKRAIHANDVRALSTTDADHALHELVDATLAGDTRLAHVGLDRLMVAGTSPISVLRALQREAARLMQAHALTGKGADVGMKLRPPVFKNMWPAFRAKMAIWSPRCLARLIERIYESEEMIKSAGPTGNAVLARLIADLSNAAAQLR